MPDVRLKTRIQNKYKTLNEWNEITAGDFIPLKGEVCYAVDGNMVFQKIGDGVTDFTQLDWLKSQSIQSDHAENDQQSFAYIKNRLGYAYEQELSVEEGLLGTLSDLMIQQLTKEEIRFLIDQFAATGEMNMEGLDTTLPEDIASYYIIQTAQGDDDYNALTKPLTENFCIRFKSGDEAFDINRKDCLISHYTQYREPYTLVMEGSARLANIWLRMAGIQAPLYDMSINADKKYTMISLINNNDLSSLTALLCDTAMCDYLGNTTDIVFFENIKEAIQPIDSKYLIEAQSNYDEMDSSKASYVYNRYGNISTGTFYVDYADPASPYIGQVILDKPATLGRPNYNRFEFTENVCSSELDFYVGEVAYDTFKVIINGEVFEQSPIFYGKELLAPGTIQDVLTYIGNPKFLSDVYSILGEQISDGKTADNADNGLPFLLTFDFNSFPALVNCILDLPYAEGDNLLIQVNPQAQSLAKKVIPKELLPECDCPWVYNEDKQSLLAPTAYEASGIGSVAIGLGTSATKQQAFATGTSTNADGVASFTQGAYTRTSKNRSAAFGYKTWSNGVNALTIGDNTYASGSASLAGGSQSTAAGLGSVAFAQGSYVSGKNSAAFGYGLFDDISDSVEGAVRPSATTIQLPAEDYDYDWCQEWSYCLILQPNNDQIEVAAIKKIAQSDNTITLTLDREVDIAYTDFEFYKATRVEGNNSFSVGSGNLIKEDSTIALGDGLISTYGYQTIIGQYNIDDDKAFIIGQGDIDEGGKNIFSVDREGNTRATSLILTTPNGTEFKINVINNALYVNDERILTTSDSSLAVDKGGTGYTSIEDTTYNVTRYRASALVSDENEIQSDINGTIHWIYE